MTKKHEKFVLLTLQSIFYMEYLNNEIAAQGDESVKLSDASEIIKTVEESVLFFFFFNINEVKMLAYLRLLCWPEIISVYAKGVLMV